ncbi:hypothetical protein Tco_1572668, partial [Tanacetum coccineum]
LCYPTNDGEDLGKLKPKANIGIFVGYTPAKKPFQIYNKRVCLIIETIHVDFDELTAIASEQFSSGPGPKLLTPGTISSGLVQNIQSSTLYVLPTKNAWEILFQPNFDEYFNPLPCVDLQVPVVIAPKPTISTGTPSSTTLDQDAPSINRFPLDINYKMMPYYFDAFLSSGEPKSYKEALTKSCWIKAMQEELNEFDVLKFGSSYLVRIVS